MVNNLRKSMSWGQHFRSRRRIFTKRRVVTSQVLPRGQYQGMRKSPSVSALRHRWSLFEQIGKNMGAEARLENHCAVRKFRWWLQSICQGLWLWIEEWQQERSQRSMAKKYPSYLKNVRDIRMYKCWEISRVEEMEDTWEERADDRTGSQRDRKRCFPVSHFTRGVGQGSHSNGYTGAHGYQASQMLLRHLLSLFRSYIV